MDFPFEKIITTEKETEQIARQFANALSPGDVVLLEGNLGSGKTFFVKALLKNFGISNVNSPTFAIVNEYSNGELKFYHFDFYRINKEYELYDIGIEDYISDENAITFIEWADLFPNAVPKADYKIKIKLSPDGTRKFLIEKV